MITLPTVYVDEDPASNGVMIPISFARTMENLVGLTIAGATLEIKTGAENIVQTQPFTFTTIDGAPGAIWWVRGAVADYVTGEIWLSLSDSERSPIGFQLRVKEASES